MIIAKVAAKPIRPTTLNAPSVHISVVDHCRDEDGGAGGEDCGDAAVSGDWEGSGVGCSTLVMAAAIKPSAWAAPAPRPGRRRFSMRRSRHGYGPPASV